MNTIGKGKVHTFLWIFVCLGLLFLTTPYALLAQTNPFVGKWGYTMLGHTGPWYTWKTEAGTMTFNNDWTPATPGTATATYSESANTCPDLNYCKTSDTSTHTYVVNADGTATFNGVMKLVMSDDGKMVIGDGTSIPGEQIFFVAVKMDPAKTYTNTDVTGQYHTGAYEYDALGNPWPQGMGKYRLWSITSDANNGNFLLNGSLNGDGSILQITGQTQPYNVLSDGTMQIGTAQTGFSTGYAGDGKVAIFSNARGGVSTDSSTFIALKKQDRPYAQTDLQGTWAYSGFGDTGGTVFRSEFGMLTCDATGICTGSLTTKKSDGTKVTENKATSTMTVSTDGKLNNFLLTSNRPHFSGAIGNDGKTMLLTMLPSPETANDRGLGIAVKLAQTGGATISFKGRILNNSKTVITEAAVTVVGMPSIAAATYDASGNFNLTGLPASTDFWLKISKSGYKDTYVGSQKSSANIDATSGPYILYTDSEIGGFYTTAGVTRNTSKGVITGTIYAQSSLVIGYVNGVALTASSANHPATPYPVIYFNSDGTVNSGSSTTSTGRYTVLNVDDGDAVTITGTKANWTVYQRVYKTFANSASIGKITGVPASTISFAGTVLDGSMTPLPGVTVAIYGNPSITTTTASDGNFTLTGLPPDTTFELVMNKSNFIPTYTSNMYFGGNSTSPRPYSLFLQSAITGWGVSPNKGVIVGRIMDNANPSSGYLSGATVTYTSSKYPASPPYTIKYTNASGGIGDFTQTSSDGKYFIFNVEEGDTVKVTATKSGWDFTQKNPKIFVTHANAASMSSLYGIYTSTSADIAAVQNNFQTAIDHYNAKAESFFNNVSLNYLDEGENYNTFYANIHNDWAGSGFQGMTYTVNSTTVTGPDTAAMSITWTSGSNNGETETQYLKNEGGIWKLYGNQTKYSVNFYSFHQEKYFNGTADGKYYAGFSIEDPNNAVISATVSGTGITSPLVFQKHGTNWWPDNQVSFGTTPPSSAAYVVTVIDASGTYYHNGTVNGGVAAFAANLAPTGAITGAITFTFNGITGGQRYGVNLFDASFNSIWNSSYDNSSTTIPYTGTTLASGTYYYAVQSKIGDNQSATSAQFTYTGSSGATISVTGKVQDPSGNYVSGIRVEKAGDTSNYTLTDSSGSYTLTGIQPGQDFTLRYTMNGALPTYSPIFNFTENTILSRYFRLYPANWNTTTGNTAGKGIINGRMREDSSNWETSFISGATVSSTIGTVEYKADGADFGGTSTFGNGQWFVRNVNPGDVITVSATKAGTSMPSRRYMAFADGVTSGSLFAVADAGTIWVTAKIVDMSNSANLGGAAVELVGDSVKSTTTNADGSFTLTRLPKNTLFHLKFSKTGHTPSYLSNLNFGGNVPSFTRSVGLFTTTQTGGWSLQTGKGVLYGGARDSQNPSLLNLEGVTVTTNPSSTVTYQMTTGSFGGTTTSSNGRFYALNVNAGNTFTVTGSKTGYTFNTSTATAFADGITLTSVTGAQLGPDETDIRNGFQTAIQLYNNRNESFFNNVSLNYLDKGENYNTFYANIHNDWAGSGFQGMTYTVNSTTVTGPDTAAMSITWTSGSNNGETETQYLKNEGGIWKLYGNQEKYRVDAYSFRQEFTMDNTYHTASGKYYAGFSIKDLSQSSIITATVSGPGISGTRDFANARGNYWWPEPVEFGTNPPSNATYTITIVDASGQYTYTKTVNGGVAAYATNLKPTGDVSGNITFTFNGITGGRRYHVELFDENWNWKWNSNGDTDSTSIAYTGSALTTGTYRFMATSFIGDNQSQTWERFAYDAGGGSSPAVTLISNDTSLGTPRYLATDGTKLYVAAVVGGAQKIISLPIGGGTVTTLYNAVNPMQVAVLGDYIYWIDPNSGPYTDTQIWKALKDGTGTKTTIYTGSSAGDPIADGSGIVAGGDGKLYTADEVQGRAHSLNADGSGLTQIGGSRYTGYFDTEHVNTITESGGVLYIADQGRSSVSLSPQVVSIPTSGGSFTTLHSGAPFNTIYDIAVGDGMIYIADYGTTTIWKMPVSGGTPAVLVSGSPFVKIHGLTYFNNALYVADDEGKAIYKVTLGEQLPPASLSLSPGWNFVSFPRNPQNKLPGGVMREVSPNVRIVWGYSSTSKGWLKYKPNGTDNTLTAMEAGKGYWIYMDNSGSIDMTNWSAPPKTITLYPGWNLAGYNGTNGAAITAALNSISGKWSIIWNWMNGNWSAHKADGQPIQSPDLSILEQNKAYWIKTTISEGTASWWQQ